MLIIVKSTTKLPKLPNWMKFISFLGSPLQHIPAHPHIQHFSSSTNHHSKVSQLPTLQSTFTSFTCSVTANFISNTNKNYLYYKCQTLIKVLYAPLCLSHTKFQSQSFGTIPHSCHTGLISQKLLLITNICVLMQCVT